MGAPLVLKGRMYQRTVPVYDAGAVAEPASVWQEYTDPKFRELVMQCRSVGKLDSIFSKTLTSALYRPACIPSVRN